MTQSTRATQAPPAGPDPANATTGELVQRLSTQLSEIVRGELAVARAELTSKGRKVGAGAGLAGAAAVVAAYGGGALVIAVVAALWSVLPLWASALIVGVALLVVAGVLGVLGRGQIRHATPIVPEQAAEGVRRDVEAVKGGLRR